MKQFSFYYPESAIVGARLDHFLAQQLPQFSRTRIQAAITRGFVTVNQQTQRKASKLLTSGDMVTFTLPEKAPRKLPNPMIAQDFFSQSTILEEADFLIINKPAGLVTHPPSATTDEVALSDLLHAAYPQTQEIGEEGREGIVHRLDKETSGLIILAKTLAGYHALRALFCSRSIQKTYIALVQGHTDRTGTIPVPIMRDPLDPKKMMASYTGNGVEAQTLFTALAYGTDSSLVAAQPKTGRTHQIRVHFTHMGHPLLGDTLYGRSHRVIRRHALHAQRLEFIFQDKKFDVRCPLPEDICACARSEDISSQALSHLSNP